MGGNDAGAHDAAVDFHQQRGKAAIEAFGGTGPGSAGFQFRGLFFQAPDVEAQTLQPVGHRLDLVLEEGEARAGCGFDLAAGGGQLGFGLGDGAALAGDVFAQVVSLFQKPFLDLRQNGGEIVGGREDFDLPLGAGGRGDAAGFAHPAAGGTALQVKLGIIVERHGNRPHGAHQIAVFQHFTGGIDAGTGGEEAVEGAPLAPSGHEGQLLAQRAAQQRVELAPEGDRAIGIALIGKLGDEIGFRQIELKRDEVRGEGRQPLGHDGRHQDDEEGTGQQHRAESDVAEARLGGVAGPQAPAGFVAGVGVAGHDAFFGDVSHTVPDTSGPRAGR